MLGEPQKRSTRKKDKRKLCKCESYCTSYNTDTQQFEGDGQWIGKSLFYEHLQADKLKHAKDDLQMRPTPSFTPIDPLTRVKNIVDEVDWLCTLPISRPRKPLVFLPLPEVADSRTSLFQLDLKSGANSFFFFIHNRLSFLASVLNDMPPSVERDVIAGRIQDELADLEDVKFREWHDQVGMIELMDRGDSSNIITAPIVCTDRYFKPRMSSHPVATAAMVVALVLQNIYFVKRRAIRVHLAGMKSILKSNNATDAVVNSIPLDPRTCSSTVDLDPVTSQYLVCPTCHCLYPYQGDLNEDAPPPLCSFRTTPTSAPCDAALWKERRLEGNLTTLVPIRKYLHQDLKSWVGRLLSRPGIEEFLDQPFTPRTDPRSPVEGIWHSEVFESLKDAAGRPFFPGPGNECRLVFGLSIDGFVPLRGKTQNASSTGIWLVLFNLPDHLRHLPENLFLVGIIPGPNKPSKEQINHYLCLLVKDLLPFWNPGVFFSRTAKYRLGRLAQAILAAHIMDHPGLRQILGLAAASTSHYLCVDCDVDVDDIHITDREEWPTNDVEHIRRFATLWRDAASEDAQQQIFDACGWRWSALWDLPYWNPILFSVVDSMHTLDLNLFQNHIRHLFGIDTEHPGGDRKSALRVKPPKKPTNEEAKREKKKRDLCKALLKDNSPSLLYNLLGISRPTLYSICVELGVVRAGKTKITGTRWHLACDLHAWRMSLKEDAILLLKPGEEPEQDEILMRPVVLNELSGSKCVQGERVIVSLLCAGPPQDGGKTISGCWGDLYKEICSKLSIRLPERSTNKSLQDTIISSIQEDPVKRDILMGFLPASKRTALEEKLASESESDALSDTDAEITDNDRPTRTRRPRKKINDGSKTKNLVIRQLTDDGTPEEIAENRRKAFGNARLPLYVELCAILDINIQQDARQKKDLHDAIVAAIDSDEDKHALLQSLAPEKKTFDAVLGEDVMNRVWDDMKLTQLPSWISSAPANWGTAKRGTLSADNWQVICTIHLPVTLIWFWRDVSNDSRKKDILRNFMDLVTASRLARLRVSSTAQVTQYDECITRYVRGIQALYPAHRLKPTHHTAMHIGDNIRKFGPVKDINTKFYERDIKFLHFIPINGKSGEIEATMSKYAARYSHLSAFLADDEQLRNDVVDLINTTESIKKEDLRGFDLASILDPSQRTFSIPPGSLPITLADNTGTAIATCQSQQRLEPACTDVYELERLAHLGVQFGIYESRYYRDSSIIFKLTDDPAGSARSGVIYNIFAQSCTDQNRHTRVHAFLLVSEHRAIAQDGLHDPYCEFGFAAGYLCRAQSCAWHVIHLSEVVSHFVSTMIPDTEYMHVLPMNQLMHDL